MRVELTGRARSEIREIGRYIAQDNPVAARTFAHEVVARCRTLAEAPEKGPVAAVRKGVAVRRLVHGSYLIFYSIGSDAVRIHRVIHGSRSPTLFLKNLDLF